jgi:hypothetical protein
MPGCGARSWAASGGAEHGWKSSGTHCGRGYERDDLAAQSACREFDAQLAQRGQLESCRPLHPGR